MFPLESLLRYRKNRRDLCRQLLAQILTNLQQLKQDRQSLQRRRVDQIDELRQLGAGGDVDIDRSAARRYYAGHMLGEIQLVDRNREVVAEQLARCRETLIRSDQEVKAIEKLREKQLADFLYDQQRREHRELDEAWLATHLTEIGKR